MMKGFTLFELLISISIIGILTSLAVVSYGGLQVNARNARRKQDIDMIYRAIEQYKAVNYLPSSGDTSIFTTGVNKVLDSWPKDPKPTTNSYIYYQPVFVRVGLSVPYCVCASMEGTNQGNSTAACGDFTTANPKDYYCMKGYVSR